MVRRRLRTMVKKYKIYYTLSIEQLNDYENRFGCKCKLLQKCGEPEDDFKGHIVGEPIKLIYAGKFYCNRWKVLAEITDTLKQINQNETKMILEIYTTDVSSKKQNLKLNDRKNSFIMGGVFQEELSEIYKKSDIALHIESKDLKNR